MKVADLGEVKLLPIDDIKPCAENPRRIPARAVEIVAESLKQFGWQQPLVVDSQHVLIVGHTRWRAAQSLKLQECPVVVATSLTDEQVRAYRIADNRTHDFTTWDYTELVTQLDTLADSFSTVLALDDWQSLVDSLDQIQVDMPPDVAADLSGGFSVTVVFRDKTSAVAAEAAIIELDGVVDIRHRG